MNNELKEQLKNMDQRFRKQFRDDFLKFIKSQTILGVAIGIVIGQAFAKLINSIIEGLVMPVMELFSKDTQWQYMTIKFAGMHFKIGIVIAALLNFFVVSLVVYLIIRHFLRLKEEDKVV